MSDDWFWYVIGAWFILFWYFALVAFVRLVEYVKVHPVEATPEGESKRKDE